jgi:hypothetical protein
MTFKKEKDNAMVINNRYKPNKCTLVVYLDTNLCLRKTLRMSLGIEGFGHSMQRP